MLASQDYLCDINLVTKDGNEFKAHRNVLSAASPFFFKLHQSNMKENQEGIVRLLCCTERGRERFKNMISLILEKRFF